MARHGQAVEIAADARLGPTRLHEARRECPGDVILTVNDLIQHGGRRFNHYLNKNGNPRTLEAAHPGNTNAVKHDVYSPRLNESRAAEIVDDLTQSFDFTVAQPIAVEQVGSCKAILEAVDRELDERGLVDKRGQAHSLLNHRSRISGQLDRWLAKIESTIERQSAGEAGRGCWPL